jgi:hypothetical protein
VSNPQPDDKHPVLITEAAPSFDDQHAARRRKYALMMSLRIPCLVGAAVVFELWPHLWWAALIILAASIPLPWGAVLIANDRPPRKSERVHRFWPNRSERALDSRDHDVIESS